MPARSSLLIRWCSWLLLVAPAAMGGAAGPTPREIAPSTVVMVMPAAHGAMERPAVEFDHRLHARAFEAEGCRACHQLDDAGRLVSALSGTTGLDDSGQLIDAFHGRCIGCHEQRIENALSSGPVTCGECHARRAVGISGREPMVFDYSLHARHAVAHPDDCGACHHVFDETTQQLKYEKGKEDACRSCHGRIDEEQQPSLRNASHRGCVSCHLDRAEAGDESGPIHCAGCHDPEHRHSIEQLEDDEIPRLVRGQPDGAWITGEDARSRPVPFDHKKHEGMTASCSGCHHHGIRACGDCHTPTGFTEGGGVTKAKAFHSELSEHSCVGCHATEASQRECAGCHAQPATLPASSTCAVCHAGPSPGPGTAELPAPDLVEIELAALPEYSDAFPETVAIASLVDRYEASKLPHAKIVARLDAGVRDSKLASRFHRDSATLCAGCHHHSPVGSRPPPCGSCHSDTDATIDKPGLKVAYHRQCIGCHMEMNIEQQGCTDCHAARGTES
jgi:hypothetical protein